uniref:Uncharacterized protein n=1 Tax=Fagus sylvatica TaxID=28930 RepID=A0A2N9GMV7_FAGSY
MSDFDVLGTVGKLALPTFARFQDLRKSELGLVRYGPANRGHRGVFGPFEGSFPIRIPADPDKFLAIREFLVVHECVFFPMCPGSQINLLRVRKTLCASVATSVGKFRNFQQNLILSACFHARGRRSSRCRIPTILVSSESLRYLLFNGPSFEELFDVASPRQDQADLVRAVLVLRADTRENPVGCKSGGSTVWNLSPNKLLRTTQVKSGDLGPNKTTQAANRVVQRFGISVQTSCSDLGTTQAANRVVQRFGISVQTRGLLGDQAANRVVQRFGIQQGGIQNGLEPKLSGPNTLRGDLTWGLPKLQIGCLTGVVVAEIVAGPHALGFLCHASSIEVVVALSAGSECTRIPYFRLSYLVISSSGQVCLMLLIIWSDDTFSIFDPSGQAFDSFITFLTGGSPLLISGLSSNFSVRGKIAPVWYNKINETFLALAIQNSLFPGFDTVTDLGDSARGVHSPG